MVMVVMSIIHKLTLILSNSLHDTSVHSCCPGLVNLTLYGLSIQQDNLIILVSENKVLTHPSTVDSITTCCGSEDHVSMGGFAARKALAVVEHVEYGWSINI